MASLTLNELVKRFGGQLVGNGDAIVQGLAPLDQATEKNLSFLANPRYLNQVAASLAGAIILTKTDFDALVAQTVVLKDPYLGRNWILAENPYAYFARAAQFFLAGETAFTAAPTIHSTALIDPSAQIAASASIGPNVIIEAGVVIGEQVRIGGNCFIGRGTYIGEGSLLYPNVSIYHKCKLGKLCIVHAGAVIGSDGFGLAPDFNREGQGEWIKIPQVGRVLIGDNVEIGANTTIDRGAMADTVIEQGCKIDNLVQIAHNVVIGAYTAIAACTGIAGSTRIGRYCMIGGAVGINGHITICDRVTIAAKSGITKSIEQAGTYSGGIPALPSKEWNRDIVLIRNLGKMRERLKALEGEIQLLKKRLED